MEKSCLSLYLFILVDKNHIEIKHHKKATKIFFVYCLYFVIFRKGQKNVIIINNICGYKDYLYDILSRNIDTKEELLSQHGGDD